MVFILELQKIMKQFYVYIHLICQDINMIWKCLIDTITEIKPKSVKINRNTLLKFDDLIIEKIILLCLKFFSDKKYKARSSKIKLFISEMKKSSFKIFNLTGVSIKKNDDLLTFFQK